MKYKIVYPNNVEVKIKKEGGFYRFGNGDFRFQTLKGVKIYAEIFGGIVVKEKKIK
jgi:hypothetical protein